MSTPHPGPARPTLTGLQLLPYPDRSTSRRGASGIALGCALAVALALSTVSCGGAAAPAPRSGTEMAQGTDAAGTAATGSADASGGRSEAAAAAEGVADAASAAVTCWYGPSVQHQSDGAERPGAALLVRRTLEPAADRIVEETARFDPVAGVKPRLYTVLYQVDGDQLTLEERDGEFSGRGTLSGEPWAWTAWSSVYTLTSGIRVEAEQRIENDGGTAVLRAERTAYGPDGSRALVLTEELARIGDDECARRFAELAP